eukprot:TRINITY_DN6748_c1_g1_i4.p1 TRINITY_DN6748_c1_g1~~TRINITY_DN6748_c1_g1_i4.p1  ORF type:complete len:107 (-),score=0.78 TRINITY_DN6748_c1_g1_i4:620-940(-)
MHTVLKLCTFFWYNFKIGNICFIAKQLVRNFVCECLLGIGNIVVLIQYKCYVGFIIFTWQMYFEQVNSRTQNQLQIVVDQIGSVFLCGRVGQKEEGDLFYCFYFNI